MELYLLNTASGLRPCYDSDYDEKKKLKLGKIYKAKITLARNYDFLKKYFALINCAWSYQNEKTTAHFKESVECFRKTVEIAAGHCDTAYNISRKEWIEVPKSIAFDKMDEADTESGKDGFMQSLEDNILEPRIYDLIKEESRKHKTDSLMADGGSLLFEKRLEQIVDKEFEKRGLQLLTFSAQLEFSKAVREKIDSRNEVNTNISVLDQQIAEQRKRNELEQLKTEQALITSRGLTKEILYKQFIDKWDGRTPIYGAIPDLIKIQN